MSWQDFERLVSDYFQRRGFKVAEFGGHGSDGGIDLIARRGDDEYVIQCKQWKAYRVGVVPVRELYGLVSKRRAAGGFVVSSGSFTDEAIRFVSGISIELIDGAKLASAITHLERAPSLSDQPPEEDDLAARTAARCPTCRGEMVLRTARTGQHAGSQFWGCARYPKCRGTRSIS
jgi:restriction system protein